MLDRAQFHVDSLGAFPLSRQRTRVAWVLALLLLVLGGVALGGPADVDDGYRAHTAQDPAIPVDRLELLLRPLTSGELALEADAWFELLRAKVEEISAAELAVKLENEEIDKAEEAATAAEEAEAAIEDAEDASQQGAAPSETREKLEIARDKTREAEHALAGVDAVETSVQDKTDLLQGLTEKREQRTALIDRLGVVLDAWEARGGEVEAYRLYVDAVAEVTIDVSDRSATWITLTGWLKSDEGGLRWGRNAAKFAAIGVVFWLLSLLIGSVVERATRGSKRLSVLLQRFLGRVVRRTILFAGLIVALSGLGLDINPLLALIGGAAFVVAFALQGTLSNFASGMLILAYRPFDVEDVVEAGGVNGKVAAMSLVSTHIRTFDNKLMIVPNNEVWGNVITNATGTDQRRVDLVFGIGYADDIAKAQAIMERILAEHELVLDDPEPIVRVHELGDSSVNFICRPWVKTEDYWEVYWGVTRAVKEEFDRQGVSIPFPQRDVHLYRADPPPG